MALIALKNDLLGCGDIASGGNGFCNASFV